MSQENLSIQEWHKKQAVDNFNYTWDLIDKTDRTKEDEMNMIHAAHASRFHWGKIGTSLNFARGEWQISRVYALLNMPESALFHGIQSLELCKDNDIGDFDLAFAYESIARAYMVSNNRELMDKYVALAASAAEKIEEQGNKDYFLSELKSITL
ncbi:hypothetical protein R9X47_16560 [Wukongibacter baidiensis]|uniref:hypothetical protein n=1 Tax=Wukongibacter baidiensis TaxID=1723361 RepID=UPI003D7FAE60